MLRSFKDDLWEARIRRALAGVDLGPIFEFDPGPGILPMECTRLPPCPDRCTCWDLIG